VRAGLCPVLRAKETKRRRNVGALWRGRAHTSGVAASAPRARRRRAARFPRGLRSFLVSDNLQQRPSLDVHFAFSGHPRSVTLLLHNIQFTCLHQSARRVRGGNGKHLSPSLDQLWSIRPNKRCRGFQISVSERPPGTVPPTRVNVACLDVVYSFIFTVPFIIIGVHVCRLPSGLVLSLGTEAIEDSLPGEAGQRRAAGASFGASFGLGVAPRARDIACLAPWSTRPLDRRGLGPLQARHHCWGVE
jgi:hypothetical protein